MSGLRERSPRVSGWLVLAAFICFGEVWDWWDLFGSTSTRYTDDEIAAVLAVGLLALSFIAWCVEHIADAIRPDGDES
jgi:hypothetical protein